MAFVQVVNYQCYFIWSTVITPDLVLKCLIEAALECCSFVVHMCTLIGGSSQCTHFNIIYFINLTLAWMASFSGEVFSSVASTAS